jgi:hypothetical protein
MNNHRKRRVLKTLEDLPLSTRGVLGVVWQGRSKMRSESAEMIKWNLGMSALKALWRQTVMTKLNYRSER